MLNSGVRRIISPRKHIVKNMHARLQRHVKHRLGSLEKGAGIDWGTAEVRPVTPPSCWECASFCVLGGYFNRERRWHLVRSYWMATTLGLAARMWVAVHSHTGEISVSSAVWVMHDLDPENSPC